MQFPLYVHQLRNLNAVHKRMGPQQSTLFWETYGTTISHSLRQWCTFWKVSMGLKQPVSSGTEVVKQAGVLALPELTHSLREIPPFFPLLYSHPFPLSSGPTTKYIFKNEVYSQDFPIFRDVGCYLWNSVYYFLPCDSWPLSIANWTKY